MKRFRHNSGFVLMETLIYIVLTVVLLTIVVAMLVQFSQINRDLRTTRAIHTTVSSLHSDIDNTMRTAYGLSETESSFNTPTGKLTFLMDAAGTSKRTIERVGDDIVLSEDGVVLGPLNPDEIVVQELTFVRYTAGSADAVQAEVSLEGSYRSGTSTHTFRTLYIPRNIYEQ